MRVQLPSSLPSMKLEKETVSLKRRNLLKSIFGFLVAPKALCETVVSAPKTSYNYLGYKGREFWSTGMVYAPYIPITALWNTPEERVEWYNKNGIDITQVETKSLNQEITEDENGNCYY